jgi:DNA-3-methyladenine glycosylase II
VSTHPSSVPVFLNMPVTRSAARIHAARITPIVNAKRQAPKRQAVSDAVATKRTKKASAPTKVKAKKTETETDRVPRPLIPPSDDEEIAPLPAQLTFSLEDAKNHLIQADHRFRDAFSLPCKPFETLEGIYPFRSVFFSVVSRPARPLTDEFRTLCTSIV